MSFTLRNLIGCRRYFTVNNLKKSMCHSARKETTSTNFDKDLDDNSSAIVNNIKNNKEYLTSKICLEALKKLSKYYPKFYNLSASERKEVLYICNELDKRTNSLNFYQAIEVFLLLIELEIPSKSNIFQSLFKTINNYCSCTNENAIKFQNVLNKMETKNLVKTIIVLIFSKSNQDILELDNIHKLSSDLYNALKKKNQEEIFSVLNKISNYPHKIPVFAAKSIFTSLIKSPEFIIASYGDLVKKIQSILMNGSSKLAFLDVYQILQCLVDANHIGTLSNELYNKEMIDTLITSVLSNGALKLKDGIVILTQLRALRHCNKSLKDHLVLKCFKDRSLISKMSIPQLQKFVSGMSFSIYKPLLWESLEQIIVENVNMKTQSSYVRIRLLYNLATMDCFPHILISQVFQLNESQYKEANFSTKVRFGLLYQLVKTLDSNYSGPWPSQSVLNILLNSLNYYYSNYQTNILLSTLEKALGGSQYIKSKMGTRFGHIVDHVIVMRKGGFPIAINAEKSRNTDLKNENIDISLIEDILVPPESRVIVILCISSYAYLRNMKQLRRQVYSNIRSLEALNYIVIPISFPEWISLSERDKIPYIMNSIREKTRFLTSEHV